MNTASHPAWTLDDSIAYYGIRNWGAGFFDVDASGNVVVRARFEEDASPVQVPLMEIIGGLRERGLEMPVMLRIENVLESSVRQINENFAQAIAASGYRGVYRGVFPIKVNQQCHMINDLVRSGSDYHHGLEAGSKAELMIAMASLEDVESLIVCNGYKDEEFITLGLYARQMGRKCIFVVETPAEVRIIIERSKAMDVAPMIGLRLKLQTRVAGRWQTDSGDRSMFGLSTLEIIEIIDMLRAADMLGCLELLHFHLGSQISDIRSIRQGVREACRFYVDLTREGAALSYIDLGGGLAVDYDGSSSSTEHSRNYSLREYCLDIVEGLQESLDPHGIEHPTIVTESGRATAAYSSILLFNILAVSHSEPAHLPDAIADDELDQIANLWRVLQEIKPKRIQEAYNDAVYYREMVMQAFHRGDITLRQRALAENIYLAIMQSIMRQLPTMDRVPVELETLPERFADIYYGNFSVFQSLPDSWAIQQVFPVLPIHRLGEMPDRQATIADLTCDCDGKLDRFVTGDGEKHTLALHPVDPAEDYYLGVFLTGAYQETLGDLHNLFGDTNVASVRINPDGSVAFVHEFNGDSISDVLSYVEYNPSELLQQFRRNAEAAVNKQTITAKQRQVMLSAFSESLRGYTYFET